MSGPPKVRSINVADLESRPVLVPAGNKARSVATARKPASKPIRKVERTEVTAAEGKRDSKQSTDLSPLSLSAPSVLGRHELLLHSNLSLNASCSSDASTDSSCSRASTGRNVRTSLTSRRRPSTPRPEKITAKVEKILLDDSSIGLQELLHVKKKCAWVTPNMAYYLNPRFQYTIPGIDMDNELLTALRSVIYKMVDDPEIASMCLQDASSATTDPAYAAFHDEEWGVSVHDDKKLFELLVLSGALAELTWPAILSKRHIFREVFMDFDPISVSKLNEKKTVATGSAASSLLSEPKLRAIIENARQILKIIDEFGSFDRYCWSFVNHKPIISRFRYPRQVPVKTPKADVISKDLVRRGFRSVGPTVVYAFMQAAGLTNDHLISCFRFEECIVAASFGRDEGNEINAKAKSVVEKKANTC